MALDMNNIPKHIAIILDGNGRWAKKRLLPRTLGHRKGAFNIRDIARSAQKIDVKYLTVFCFSTENWNRPEQEVKYLMNAPIRYFKHYYKDIVNSSMRIKFIGRKDRLPQELLEVLEKVEQATADHSGLTLTLCIDYGSHTEITTAVQKIAQKVLDKELAIEDITAQTVEDNLYTAGYPKLDLLIRTSGEIRISNFLLWQLAYAELYFTDVLWPDFDEAELIKAIENYQSRNRRFGGIDENK